ncbi:MAG TPA: rhomboid family intramembrane serine protease [Aestuariivirga sp.]|nr:rhomboid family intramembrane serine protease [Hyphomicrobiales bacterium]MBZ0259578.1 rhomboid family intramembrane serine protease [Hyphomicrobiales bacterium]HQX84122.1 rhomboid family intramembrane serine protease [Aestuariivirga sp.]HQY73060.1 rhomboid family intramembrane serine protease [Aestuariivirga sp.]
MFVPLHDDTPLKVIRFQFVTIAIIAGNILVFLMTGAFQSETMLAGVATSFGVVPSDLTTAFSQNIPYSPIPEPLTFLTYMFLHAGWLHLISNMLFLWVFADNIEDAFGYFAFVLFYLLCGIAGALAHVLMSPASTAPLIGASAAVSGVIGAYMLLYPRARVWILLFFRIPLRISAIWVLGGWFLLQIFSVLTTDQSAEVEVAWWAHIGGFVAGLAITFLLRSRLLVRTSR